MVQPGHGPPRRARRAWSAASRPVVIGVIATLVGTYARWWVRRGNIPLVWNDSFDYLASAETPWLSSDRWLGPRPGLMPSVLSLSQLHYRTFVTVQTVIAGVAWGLLAAAVASVLPVGWRRWLAALVVLVVSLTWPVTMWDQQVLTESLALSSLAILAAAIVYAASGLDRTRAALLVVAAVPALAVRDSHVIPVALAALGVGIWELVRSRRGHGRPRLLPLLTAGYLVAMSFVAAGSAQYGHRGRVPLEHVYAVRVLPYPERVRWFADHGMPNGPEFEVLPPVLTPGKADYTGLSPLPVWKEWREWLGDSGRSALLQYMVTHPDYLVAEPQRRPERVFNNGEGLPTYRPLRMRKVPLVDPIGYPAPLLAVAASMPLLVLASWRRVIGAPLTVAGALLVVTSIPHALVVWHSDGMESARHLLIPSTQARVGAFLILLSTLLSTPRVESTGPEVPAEVELELGSETL